MCVDYQGYDWERPAEKSDVTYFSRQFPNIDFAGFLDAMSQDGARPLTTDLALIGGMLSTEPDALGMCFVPFVGVENGTNNVVKLPVMNQIVEWFENSALGSDMWQHASDFCEKNYGGRFHFAMNCGCGMVSNQAKESGSWSKWQQVFNTQRTNLYGKTRVVSSSSNTIETNDITSKQLMIWYRMREALESLPQQALVNCQQAA
jgi:hypothetical protein